MRFPLQFDFIPYPLWRRSVSSPAARVLFRLGVNALTAGNQPMDTPENLTPARLADALTRWNMLPAGMSAQDVKLALERAVTVEYVAENVVAHADPPDVPIRLPAQWEPIEAVITAFPVLYPPLWKVHAAMIQAIAEVARVDVLIPHTAWSAAIKLWMDAFYPGIVWERVRFIVTPLNDIWVRDYGPIVGHDSHGKQVAIDARFSPLSAYPQAEDDRLPVRWAALRGMPVHHLPLYTEGGNIWSDGAGTLIMSDELIDRHAQLGLSRDQVESDMHRYYAFEKLILTPRLWREETGHVDLVCKLADAHTILVGAATPFKNADRLRAARALFGRETNAAGERYRVIDLPMPQVTLNWGVYPIWRSYTNSLTVNGRVLVPVFGLPSDSAALRIYQAAMPDHQVIPIACEAAVKGGGAVHCLTKEIPAAR